MSAGERSARVLLTKHASAVESDAWIRLEWDEQRAFWNGAPRALAWGDIPKKPVGLAARAVPYLQSLMALRDGRLRLYHTSTEIGSLGNVRGGWAWSLLVTLSDAEQPVGIDEVIGGYGHAASDGSVFLIKAGRGNKLHVYDAHPRELGALPLTPKLIGAKTWRQSFDVDADDLWLSTSDGVSHVKLSGLDRAGTA